MLLASFHSMMETTVLLLILAIAVLRYEAQKFASKHPETAKKGAQIIGGLILRHLKKW